MRKHLKKHLPNHEAIHNNRWLRPFRNSLLHPRLWHLNRHSAAGAVAAGHVLRADSGAVADARRRHLRAGLSRQPAAGACW